MEGKKENEPNTIEVEITRTMTKQDVVQQILEQIKSLKWSILTYNTVLSREAIVFSISLIQKVVQFSKSNPTNYLEESRDVAKQHHCSRLKYFHYGWISLSAIQLKMVGLLQLENFYLYFSRRFAWIIFDQDRIPFSEL